MAKIRIVYKSGYVQDIKCESFKIRKTGSVLTNVEWSKAVPDPMVLGVDEIAAIFEL